MTRSWLPPEGLATRGTVVVLPGRGEHAGVYTRFGRRLAADAYRVYGLDVAPEDHPAAVRRMIDALADDAVAPLVLAGSDTGALHALAYAAERPPALSGLLLAGLPVAGQPTRAAQLLARRLTSWDAELDARTVCPTHRGHLDMDDAFVRGRLSDPPAPALVAALADGPDAVAVPALVVHGTADPVAPVAVARTVAARLRHAELAVVEGGHHDVLNDVMHRSVAAQVVQWLERLRGGPELPGIIRIEPVTTPAPAAPRLLRPVT